MAGWLHTEISVRHRELNPDMVAHLGNNRAQRRLTLLIKANVLTTKNKMVYMMIGCTVSEMVVTDLERQTWAAKHKSVSASLAFANGLPSMCIGVADVVTVIITHYYY